MGINAVGMTPPNHHASFRDVKHLSWERSRWYGTVVLVWNGHVGIEPLSRASERPPRETARTAVLYQHTPRKLLCRFPVRPRNRIFDANDVVMRQGVPYGKGTHDDVQTATCCVHG